MSKKIDINVEERSHKPYDSNFELLKLEIGGSDSNIPLINSFRRACNDNVPKYAFVRELIKINNNKSAYHNDYMTLRLSQLPVFNVKSHDIDPKLDYLHEKYWKDVDYLDKNRNKPDNEKNIEIQINVHNNSDELKAITTSDPGVKVYIDNELVSMYDKQHPILIIYLKPNDTFNCSMKAVLGVGEKDTIWAAASNCWHYYDNDDRSKNIIVEIKSSGLIEAYDIADRSCGYLIKKLEIIKKEIMRQVDNQNIQPGVLDIKLENEDYTMGGIINYELQSHKNIIFSGVTKPDHLIRNMVIKIQTKDITHDEFKQTVEECFQVAHDKVLALKTKINNIYQKKNTNSSNNPKKTSAKLSRDKVKSKSKSKHNHKNSESD